MKPKPLPESLQAILRRLGGEDGTEPYPSAALLLEELDAAGAAVPANAAAWERFVRQVREQATDDPLGTFDLSRRCAGLFRLAAISRT